ncbi:MAG TPA: LacI family DNA-binding transcriptional regulator [Streptosporangiaceae bacterium]|jgi:LacI family transcriptional regulator|nr:LacI family DNA-binding transcriptional regulator [Streptosporangiaceae bacterium]
MKDVAAQLGVSTATVSRALKDDPAISLATRQAVAEVAQRVQYRPSAAARRLRTKSTSLIGVVMQSVGDGYIGAVVLGIQSRARELGYQPLFFATEGRTDLESQALEVFLSEQVTELITVSPSASVPRQAVAEGLHVAVINSDEAVPAKRIDRVATGRAIPPPGTPRAAEPMIKHIAFDDLGAGRLATTYLIELGHQSFVHLRGPNVRSSLLRLLGYRQALTAAGLWPQPVLTAAEPVMQAREAAVAEFLSKAARPPVAMVAYDDMSAVAALHAAHRAGWRVPEDLSVVGIDDIQFAAYTNPGLTTVAQPKQRLGALAVDAVLEKDAAEVTVLDGELVIRESTIQPAAGGAT